VYIKPDAKKFKIDTDQDELVVFCREPPVKGKSNRESIKELSKLFDKKVEILSGFTSRRKKILIKDTNEEEVKKALL